MTQYDSRARAENGAWLHLRNPATGDLLMDGESPVMVKVQGYEGRSAIAAASQSLRKRSKPTSVAEIEANHAKNAEDVKALILEFSSVDRGDKPAVVPDDVDWFLSLGIPVGQPDPNQKTFAEQISDFARDRTNYLGNGSKP